MHAHICCKIILYSIWHINSISWYHTWCNCLTAIYMTGHVHRYVSLFVWHEWPKKKTNWSEQNWTTVSWATSINPNWPPSMCTQTMYSQHLYRLTVEDNAKLKENWRHSYALSHVMYIAVYLAKLFQFFCPFWLWSEIKLSAPQMGSWKFKSLSVRHIKFAFILFYFFAFFRAIEWSSTTIRCYKYNHIVTHCCAISFDIHLYT